MFVGCLCLVLHIPAAQTLKDRRRVLNRIKDRIRARLSVSLCELGEADRQQLATLAVATVARDAVTCRHVLETARKLAETVGDAWLTEVNGEIIALGERGQGLRGGIEAFDSGGIVETEGREGDDRTHHSAEERLDGAVPSGDSEPPTGRTTPLRAGARSVKRLRKK